MGDAEGRMMFELVEFFQNGCGNQLQQTEFFYYLVVLPVRYWESRDRVSKCPTFSAFSEPLPCKFRVAYDKRSFGDSV